MHKALLTEAAAAAAEREKKTSSPRVVGPGFFPYFFILVSDGRQVGAPLVA